MARLVIPYKPRDVFKPYHETQARFLLTIAHRRAGKTVARINRLIRKAVECKQLNPRFGYLAPYYVQAKDIAWVYLKHYSAPIVELGGKVNESELSITFPHNNAVIKLYGAENAERMRGLYFDGISIDEAQGIAKSVLTTIIMPALADRQGWLDVAGTVRGMTNLLAEIYQENKDNPEWFIQFLKASETGIIPQEELARLQSMMSENEYQQEFECDFYAAITGAIYGKWMAAATKEGRITDNVRYDPAFPVYTAWDLGYGDATVIWFYQVGYNEILLVDYYEFSGEAIGHYCDVLKAKGYKYHVHYLPHDALHETQASGGRSILEQMTREHGIENVRVMPAVDDDKNGHEAVRVTLPRCWFNATACHNGIEALRNYHYQWDEELKVFRRKAVHNWSSHASKAFELIARTWREQPITSQQLKSKEIVNKFYRLRQENNIGNIDPYRTKPGTEKRWK